MQAFEFEVDSVDDVVRIPHEYAYLFNKHIKFIAMLDENKTREQPQHNIKSPLTDEYIKNNWRKLLQEGFRNYDESYYKSEQYKIDRGAKLMEKYK